LFSDRGLVRVEANQVPRFHNRRLPVALRDSWPSFAGTDILYAPATMPSSREFNIPSTQWLVGLVEGNDSLLVAAWETNAQPNLARPCGNRWEPPDRFCFNRHGKEQLRSFICRNITNICPPTA
jgi:hypothetical protein